MTRMRIMAATLAAVALAVPAASPAAPALGGTLIQCMGLEYVNATHTQGASCTGTSNVMTPGLKLSLIETHANFHARTATGSITMEWWDATHVRDANNVLVPNPQLIAKLTCQAAGLYVDVPNSNSDIGLADASSQPFCTVDQPQAESYALGTQTLKVTALGDSCVGNDPGARNGECWFHGYVYLNQVG